MKSALFKRIIIALFLQALFIATVCGQKYTNGTRLLKGAEVLSDTPLQLDYVLENLSDTANVNSIHEGKTHLILNDGSGVWREWWYYMGKWRLKHSGGSSGLENSIQIKDGNGFAGTALGINEGFLYSLDETPSDVGINNKTATVRVTPQSQAIMEATKQGAKGNITHYIYVSGNEAEQNITWIGSTPRKGARLRMDTTILEHAQTSMGFDFWNFRSSLPDTTFYVKKRLKFDQPNTSVYIKNGDLRLKDKSGDYSLSDLKSGTETDPTVPTHVKNITAANVSNWNTAYTNSHTHGNKTVLDGITSTNVTNWTNAFNWGNHSTQGYLKAETDPVWTAAKGDYYTKTNLQTSGQAAVHWSNLTNIPTLLQPAGVTNAIQTRSGNSLAGADLRIVDGKNISYSSNNKYNVIFFDDQLISLRSDNYNTNATGTVTVNPSYADLYAASGTAGQYTYNKQGGFYATPESVANTVSWGTDLRDEASLKLTADDYGHARKNGATTLLTNFRSSLVDTTFYINKRISFDQAKTKIYAKGGDLRLSDRTGDFALSDLVGGSSGGSVTSVGLSLPNIFTVSGTPVTGSGTLSASLASQTKNTVLAAPVSANGTPSFRILQETDLPTLNWNKIYNTPTILANYGITDAYTKTETNELLNIAGNNNQMLMLYNKRPVVIPRTTVSVQSTHTEFMFSGYQKTWEYPDIRYPASMMVDATGFNFNGSWLNYRTQIDTRSGRLYFSASNDDYPEYTSLMTLEGGRIYQKAYDIDLHAKSFYLGIQDGSENKTNTFWTNPDEAKFELRNRVGEYTYHTDLRLNDGSFSFFKSIEKDNTVWRQREFYVGESLFFDRYLSYSSQDTTMRVLNKVSLMNYQTPDAGTVSVTENDDMMFESAASEQTKQGITLAEIIQKGQIFTQAAEPQIPDHSFAFWINGNTFYLILRGNGLQKKVQLQ